MVYNGPRRGCQACQRRRVKCDAVRPACSNCTRRREQCCGYKDEFEVVLRDQTNLVPQKIERRDDARKLKLSKAHQRSFNTIQQLNFSRMIASIIERSSVPQSVILDPEVEALQFFFLNHVMLPKDRQIARGFLELLLPLHCDSNCNSPLSLATSAVALQVLSLWSQRSTDSSRAIKMYTKAVASVTVALKSSEESKSDGLLAAVLMLDFYETVQSRWTNKPMHESHQHGALALVEYRGRTSFDTDISRRLLLAVRNRFVFQGFTQAAGVHSIAGILNDSSEMPETLGTKLDLISIQAADLQRRGVEVITSFEAALRPSNPKHVTQLSTFEALLDQAHALESQLQQWLESTPKHWNGILVPLREIHPTLISAGIYRSLCEVYPNIYVCNILNIYRWTRIIVLQSILRCDNALQEAFLTDSGTQQRLLKDKIQDLVDSICATIPFCLGNRTQPARLVDFRNIRYPPPHPHFGHFEPLDTHVGTTISNDEHMRISVVLGAFFTLNVLLPLLGLCKEGNVQLRPGQRDWISGQVRRVKGLFGKPHANSPQ